MDDKERELKALLRVKIKEHYPDESEAMYDEIVNDYYNEYLRMKESGAFPEKEKPVRIPKLLKPNEVKEMLGISDYKLKKLRENRLLPHFKLSRSTYRYAYPDVILYKAMNSK